MTRVRRVPAWGWIALLVLLSAAVRALLVRGMPAPFIFVDELIYSELAKSVAAGDGFSIRGVATTGYSTLYPLLVAPAYSLENLVRAHTAAQLTNAVVMSLAAVPAFALARRVAREQLALLVALATVLVPSMAYAGTITTESLFYPIALGFALALVRYLEHPGARRLIVLGIALAAAYLTRSQALSFVPAILLAPPLLALLRGRSELRRYAALYGVVACGALAVLVVQVVRGQSLSELLGAYSIVGERDYDAGTVLRFWLWHVQVLTLYVAIVPVATLVLLAARGRSLPPRVQEHLAATCALVICSTLVVGAFASAFASDRVQDRYLFFLTPLLLCALAAWVELGAPRPPLGTALALGGSMALALVFPYTRFIVEGARSDTLSLLPLWWLRANVVDVPYWLIVLVAGGVLCAVVALVPSDRAVAALVGVIVVFVLCTYPVWSSPKDPLGFKASSVGALFQGIRSVERNWLDRATPAGGEIVALWTQRADRFTINQNEFFNRRVGQIFYTVAPTPGGVGETRVTRRADGVYVDPDGRPVRARFALLDASVVPDGDVVARDEALGTTLWRLSGPLAQTTTVTGIYPGDTWSGQRVTWSRLRCRPGVLETVLWSDPNLFTRPQTVTASATGGARAVVRVDPATQLGPDTGPTLSLRVVPRADGRCVVRLAVTPTAVPSAVDPSSEDDRELGIHVGPLSYTPDR